MPLILFAVIGCSGDDADGAKGGGSGRGGSQAAGSGGSGGVVPGGGGTTNAGASNGGAGSGGTAAGGSAGENGQVDAAAMARDMGFGTNIGNTLENTTTWETGWGQPSITQTFINGMAAQGIKTVRVPVAWDTYASNGVIDATKLNRVKEVVSWIQAAGMYSIVNIHWDGGWIFNESKTNEHRLTVDVKTKFASYWTQIATGFADVGHKLILEGLNEEARFYVNGDPEQAPDYAALNELNQLFVSTVRDQGGYNQSRALLIAGFHTDIKLTCVEAFEVPTDPAGAGKLFLSIHYYDPYTFSLMDAAEWWGSPSTTWGTDADKAALKSSFDTLAAFSTKNGIPVVLGEFAVTRGQNFVREPASRIAWMESVAGAALSHGMVPVLWDTGSEISRTDGTLSTELRTVLDHLAQ